MSNETKWTPGTWFACHPEDLGMTVARLDNQWSVKCDEPVEPSEHDAHLIAAAPELYEALESMLEDGVWDGDNWIPSDNANQRADAVLAKARGEQS